MNHCMGSSNEGVDWGPFYRLGRRMSQQLPGVVLHDSWLVLVPVVWIIFTQFLKSWFEVFVEYI